MRSSGCQLREDLAPGFVANCAAWKDMPHRGLGRSLGALTRSRSIQFGWPFSGAGLEVSEGGF
jgi:hypothetical protein